MERDKKENIVCAATRLFARFGFKKTSVDQIAKDAGVAKGTVYLAADTKEDLFYQAVHREVRAHIAEMSKLIEPRKPADQLMIEVILASLRYLDERPLVRGLIFGHHQLLLPEWAERLDELRALGRSVHVELLELGKRQGIFRADLDVDALAMIIQDLSIATEMFHMRGPDREERLRRRLMTAFDCLMNGVRAPAKDARPHAETPHALHAKKEPRA